MIILRWQKDRGQLRDAKGGYDFFEKPAFSFNYNSFNYDPVGRYYDDNQPLDKRQQVEIEAFAYAIRRDHPNTVVAADVDNKFIGWVDVGDPRIGKIVPVAPPTDDHYVLVGDNEWRYVIAVDAQGSYLGNIDASTEGVTLVDTQPNDVRKQVWSFRKSTWVEQPLDLRTLQLNTMSQIDSLFSPCINAAILAGDYRKTPLIIATRDARKEDVKTGSTPADMRILINRATNEALSSPDE